MVSPNDMVSCCNYTRPETGTCLKVNLQVENVDDSGFVRLSGYTNILNVYSQNQTTPTATSTFQRIYLGQVIWNGHYWIGELAELDPLMTLELYLLKNTSPQPVTPSNFFGAANSELMPNKTPNQNIFYGRLYDDLKENVLVGRQQGVNYPEIPTSQNPTQAIGIVFDSVSIENSNQSFRLNRTLTGQLAYPPSTIKFTFDVHVDQPNLLYDNPNNYVPPPGVTLIPHFNFSMVGSIDIPDTVQSEAALRALLPDPAAYGWVVDPAAGFNAYWDIVTASAGGNTIVTQYDGTTKLSLPGGDIISTSGLAVRSFYVRLIAFRSDYYIYTGNFSPSLFTGPTTLEGSIEFETDITTFPRKIGTKDSDLFFSTALPGGHSSNTLAAEGRLDYITWITFYLQPVADVCNGGYTRSYDNPYDPHVPPTIGNTISYGPQTARDPWTTGKKLQVPSKIPVANDGTIITMNNNLSCHAHVLSVDDSMSPSWDYTLTELTPGYSHYLGKWATLDGNVDERLYKIPTTYKLLAPAFSGTALPQTDIMIRPTPLKCKCSLGATGFGNEPGFKNISTVTLVIYQNPNNQTFDPIQFPTLLNINGVQSNPLNPSMLVVITIPTYVAAPQSGLTNYITRYFFQSPTNNVDEYGITILNYVGFDGRTPGSPTTSPNVGLIPTPPATITVEFQGYDR